MGDARRRVLTLAMILILPACSPSAPDKAPETPPVAANDSANALEALAAESGVIGEEGSLDIVGSYGRSYTGGTDRLCVLPAGRSGKTYRFGVEIWIGDEENCRGTGQARRSGDLLLLQFDGGRCTITAQYEGDRIMMPGVVDKGCASLCSTRGSLAGVSFPRVGMDAAAALSVRGNDDKALCTG